MLKIVGSAFYCTLAEFKLQLITLESLVNLDVIKKSDYLFWDTAYKWALNNGEDGERIFVPFNVIFDFLVGSPNPDHKNGAPLKYSRQNRSLKINNWSSKQMGEFIVESDKSQDELGIFTKGKVYQFQNTDIAKIEPRESITVVRESNPFDDDIDRIFINQIDKVYSFYFSTNFLDNVLAPDSHYPKKTIVAEFSIQVGPEEYSTIGVTLTCYDDSRLMTPKDRTIAKYFDSACVQKMWENRSDFASHKLGNMFTFNLKEVLLSTGSSDSGSSRWDLYLSILRISANAFKIDGTKCPTFMKDAHFIDEDGNVLTKANYTLLRLIGEHDGETVINPMTSKGQAPEFVTVAIPDNLYYPTLRAIVRSLANEDYTSVMPKLFGNDYKVKFLEVPGYQDTLADYLKSRVVVGNHMKTTLKNVMSKLFKANETKTDFGVTQFFRMMDNTMFFYSGKKKGSRSQVRFTQCIGFFQGFVFQCKVKDDKARQFTKLEYDISFHLLYPHQARKVERYLDEVRNKVSQDQHLYISNLSFMDSEFLEWYKQTMTVEGMKLAKKFHDDNVKETSQNLSLIPLQSELSEQVGVETSHS